MKQLSIRLIAIALFLFPTIIMAQGSKEEMDAWMAYMTPGSAANDARANPTANGQKKSQCG